MKQTPTEERIAQMIEPVVNECGFDLVVVKLLGEENGTTLQIMAENPQTKRLGIDDCKTLSREISAILDVEDPIQSAYRLEISSPGIDRPLVRLEDFTTYKGCDAKIEIAPPIDGQKRYRGHLRGVDGNVVNIETDKGMHAFPFESIQKAKLVLTDELIEQTKNL